MSQFDLPRINFHGKVEVSAATANNVNNTPLTFYDPLLSELILPPRVYLSEIPGSQVDAVLRALPEGTPIINQGQPDQYFEIEPVVTDDDFKEWVITPLGQSPLDKDYHGIYPLLPAERSPTGGVLEGKIPGYWNYFGPMTMNFKDVTVNSVTVLRKGKEIIYSEGSPRLPKELAPLMGAELSTRKDPNDPNSFSTAVMVDVTPSTSTFTHVFCDNMFLKGEKLFFQAKPSTASLRGLNFSRVVNAPMPQSASGEFFSTIALDQLPDGDQNPLVRILKKWQNRKRKLKGIFIRYNMFEVFEDRDFSYLEKGKVNNPAVMTLAGSLSPWYEGDMQTITIGRQLQFEEPFYQQFRMVPMVADVDYRRRCVTFDLFNNIPQVQRPDGSYESLDLGTLEFRLDGADGNEYSLGKLRMGPEGFNREESFRTGGIISFPLGKIDNKTMRNGTLRLYKKQGKEKAVPIMREIDYVVYSDQSGLYANQGDDPQLGYLSGGHQKEPCVLRVYSKGNPVKKPVLFSVVEFRVDKAGTGIQSSVIRHQTYADGDTIAFSTDGPKNSIFLLLPGYTSMVPKSGLSSIFLTGSVIHLRVLPRQDYSRYLDPLHPDYPEEVSFENLYQEIFRTYNLIYPAMGQIIPFTREVYDNEKMAKKLLKRIRTDRWDQAKYMPISRDMSDAQKALIYRWAQKFGIVETDVDLVDPVFAELLDIHRHR